MGAAGSDQHRKRRSRMKFSLTMIATRPIYETNAAKSRKIKDVLIREIKNLLHTDNVTEEKSAKKGHESDLDSEGSTDCARFTDAKSLNKDRHRQTRHRAVT